MIIVCAYTQMEWRMRWDNSHFYDIMTESVIYNMRIKIPIDAVENKKWLAKRTKKRK